MLPLVEAKRLNLEDFGQNGNVQNDEVERERERDSPEKVEVVKGVSVPGEDALARGKGVKGSEHFDGHQDGERDGVRGVI